MLRVNHWRSMVYPCRRLERRPGAATRRGTMRFAWRAKQGNPRRFFQTPTGTSYSIGLYRSCLRIAYSGCAGSGHYQKRGTYSNLGRSELIPSMKTVRASCVDSQTHPASTPDLSLLESSAGVLPRCDRTHDQRVYKPRVRPFVWLRII